MGKGKGLSLDKELEEIRDWCNVRMHALLSSVDLDKKVQTSIINGCLKGSAEFFNHLMEVEVRLRRVIVTKYVNLYTPLHHIFRKTVEGEYFNTRTIQHCIEQINEIVDELEVELSATG